MLTPLLGNYTLALSLWSVNGGSRWLVRERAVTQTVHPFLGRTNGWTSQLSKQKCLSLENLAWEQPEKLGPALGRRVCVCKSASVGKINVQGRPGPEFIFNSQKPVLLLKCAASSWDDRQEMVHPSFPHPMKSKLQNLEMTKFSHPRRLNI